MPNSGIFITVDASTVAFDRAMAAADKRLVQYSAQLRLAQRAQLEFDAAVAASGPASAEAALAQQKLGAALARTTVAEQRAALAAKQTAEVQAAASAKAAAAAEAAAAKQAAAQRKLGTVFGTVGIAAAAALGLAAKAASDFNAKMATVSSLSHASAAEIQGLTQAANGFADIGVSATEAADAEIELVKAGISAKDIMGGALAGALNLAAAGQASVADSAQIAAVAMTQFELAAKDVPHLADLLAAGADKALGSVTDLGYGLSQAGLPAHQLGVSVEETVGALAEFAQAGLIGERGGTTLKQMFLKLEAPSEKARATMEKFNLTLYDAQGNFVGLANLADQLQKGLSGVSQQTRDTALATIFGSRAIQGANILYQDGAKGVAAWTEKVNDSGFAAEQAAGKMDSLQGDLQKLGATIQNDLIDVGQQLQPILRDITQALTTFGDIIGGLPDPVKAAAVEVGAVVAALGLGFWAFTRIKAAAVGLAETLGILATAQTRVAITAGEMAAGSGAATAAMARQSAVATGLMGRLNMGGLGKAGAGLGLLLGAGVAGQQGGAAGSIGSMTLNAAGATLLLGGSATLALPVGALAALFAAMKNARDTAGPGFGRSTTGDFSGGVGPGSLPTGTGAFSGGGPPSGWTTPAMAQYRTSAAQTAKVLEQLGETGQQTYSDLASGAAGIQHAAVSLESLAKAAHGAWAETLKMANVVLTRRGDWSSYQQAIDDASAALKANGKTLDQTTQAGRDNAAVLDNIAASAATYAQTVKDPVLKLKFMQESRHQLYETARNFGDTKAEAWKYVDSVLGIPKDARTLAAFEANEALTTIAGYEDTINAVPGFKDTVITAHAEQAIADAQRLIGLLGAIHSKDVWINVNQNFTHTGVQQQYAAGGQVHGAGSATSDSILARLSNREFVQPVRSVDHYGVGMMEAIRTLKFPKQPVQRFAGGGPVMSQSHQWHGGGAMQQVVNVNLDGYRIVLDTDQGSFGATIRKGAQAVVSANQAQLSRMHLAGSSQ